jgi:transposase InsO family protein
MVLHANAKLGLSGRFALVCAIEQGLSLKAAAAAFSVSPATAHRWWHRWLEGGRCREALADRSSRPHHSPRQLERRVEESILEARRQTGYGPGRLAGIVRRARSTIWKVLHRRGVSRLPRPQPAPSRRYEWSRPGALLHIDVKKLARFEQPGHRVTGDRQTRSRRVGYDYLHVVVDDNSRYAYVELHPTEDAETAARVLERALTHLHDLGVEAFEAVMTDNALAYTRGQRFQAVLGDNELRHITTPPYTPRWNGKAERFIQTLQREWAYVRVWPDSHSRARALQSFIRYYNRRRPHGSLDGQPPISRIHNVCGSYT